MGNVKLWTILFLCIAIQGFFLSFLIISGNYRRNKRINFFLGLFIALFSLIMLFWVGHWNSLFTANDVFTFIYRPIPLLLGPFLYYYIKSYFEKVLLRDLVHCVPFIVLSIYFLPAYINYNEWQNVVDNLWNWEMLGYFINTLSTIYIVFYSI